MHRRTLFTTLTLGMLALVLADGLAAMPVAQAAKPPPAPTATPAPLDTGWVYSFGGAGTDRAIYRTSPDGATNGVVAGAPADYGWFVTDPPPVAGGGSVGRPSHLRHDGSRWYLAFRWDSADVVFPNANGGSTALDVDAVRQGDAAGVTLTSSRASCIHIVGESAAWASNTAGAPDTVVTWLGAQWADQDGDPAGTCETLVAGGIFRANLSYDGAGAVVGASAPVLAVPVPMNTSTNRPDVLFFSWSPDGAQVAYTRESNGDLYVAPAGSSVANHVMVAAGTYRNVDWSPDQDAATAGLQTTIAFSGWGSGVKVKGGVWAVKPNGSGLTLLAEAVRGSTVQYAHQTPYWSPKGTHLAYEEHQSQWGAYYTHTIRRMAKDGSGNVVLVAESPAQPIHSLLGWEGAD